jgi:hypothetical protein
MVHAEAKRAGQHDSEHRFFTTDFEHQRQVGDEPFAILYGGKGINPQALITDVFVLIS